MSCQAGSLLWLTLVRDGRMVGWMDGERTKRERESLCWSALVSVFTACRGSLSVCQDTITYLPRSNLAVTAWSTTSTQAVTTETIQSIWIKRKHTVAAAFGTIPATSPLKLIHHCGGKCSLWLKGIYQHREAVKVDIYVPENCVWPYFSPE